MNRSSYFAKNFHSSAMKSAKIQGITQWQYSTPQKISKRQFCLPVNNSVRNWFPKISLREKYQRQIQTIMDGRQNGRKLFSKKIKDQSYKPKIFNERYRFIETIAEGTQATVFKALDLRTRRIVAVKMYKEFKYKNHEVEKETLQDLMENDRKGIQCFSKMLDCFEVDDFYPCYVFEMFDKNLGDVLLNFEDDIHYRKLKISQIREIGYQLCSVIGFMHECYRVHYDLQPSNIMLLDGDLVLLDSRTNTATLKRTDIRLIDFGSSLSAHKVAHERDLPLCTEFSPPEYFLEFKDIEDSGYGNDFMAFGYDVWSIGCILFELFTGERLFPTCVPGEDYIINTNTEWDECYFRLHVMERRLEKIPEWMWNEPPAIYKNSHSELENKMFELCPKKVTQNLFDYKYEYYSEQYLLFDLIKKMLCLDPRERINMDDALRHSFFQNVSKPQTTCLSFEKNRYEKTKYPFKLYLL